MNARLLFQPTSSAKRSGLSVVLMNEVRKPSVGHFGWVTDPRRTTANPVDAADLPSGPGASVRAKNGTKTAFLVPLCATFRTVRRRIFGQFPGKNRAVRFGATVARGRAHMARPTSY
jgi:hypothetical protein